MDKKKVTQKLHAIILPGLMKNNRVETLVFTGLFLCRFLRNGYRFLLALDPNPVALRLQRDRNIR